MKTLHLLRHAKSDRNGQMRDHDRPLAKRGIEAAEAMALYLSDIHFAVDGVYCSSAKRTRETYELIKSALGGAPVRFREDLYLLDEEGLLDAVHALPAGDAAALFIGHDPGFHILANLLVKDGREADLSVLRGKFPTGALCTLTFQGASWSAVKPGAGRLAAFVRPKDFD